jgi:hypothetical protein
MAQFCLSEAAAYGAAAIAALEIRAIETQYRAEYAMRSPFCPGHSIMLKDIMEQLERSSVH